ncbi:MAG: glycosyl transferase [Acetobacteraceae bacterium]|nr:glycosyl transferase [Acetobacteraceae bacterium]
MTSPPSSPPLIVTGGDSVYFPMIEELRLSLLAAFPDNPPPFGVIDAGLSPAQVDRLRAAETIVASLPDDPALPSAALRKRPALAANFGKLWLDRMFPGHEVLIWLDADTWVQDPAAIRLVAGAARTGALAIVPGGGRYWERHIEVRWMLRGLWGLAQVRSFNFKNGRHAGLSLSVLRDLATRPLLNAGVFGLRADAPHWAAMRRWQARILRHGKPFTSDQIAMALAVHVDGLRVELLPDTCNYIRPWRFDPREPALVEFWYPYPKVGIVHLAGQKEMRFDLSATTEVLDLLDQPSQLSLRYGRFQAMAHRE